MGDFKFRKKERIIKRSEFQTILKQGIRYSAQNFNIIIYQRSGGELRRLGISISKKVGGAVKRNRVKRLLREFFRLNKDNLPEASDLLFIAKPGSVDLNYSSLAEQLSEFFKRI